MATLKDRIFDSFRVENEMKKETDLIKLFPEYGRNEVVSALDDLCREHKLYATDTVEGRMYGLGSSDGKEIYNVNISININAVGMTDPNEKKRIEPDSGVQYSSDRYRRKRLPKEPWEQTPPKEELQVVLGEKSRELKEAEENAERLEKEKEEVSKQLADLGFTEFKKKKEIKDEIKRLSGECSEWNDKVSRINSEFINRIKKILEDGKPRTVEDIEEELMKSDQGLELDRLRSIVTQLKDEEKVMCTVKDRTKYYTFWRW